ncbi:MAG: glycine cleavage system protein H, partial [Armatimonadetes bacterium]|nr:glycine cleavage system protein H [Armatimonadota bacterium]
MYPADLMYRSVNVGAMVEDGGVRVGITKFAAERLTDIVFVELPQVGAQVRYMESFGVVESVKAVSD